ncbi:hypothetical protein CPB83DRAFT_894783 [Crepidotus variabilis]|uniref:DUF6593 domain-containing protein n=1 Tax=Crepidotus variabilis TaxID=179855 RepID=A0A9P6EFF9_9AGAR|nr:hypothetical protein CPB83DRAFT_894783 [Crepidotus variabilis]
MQLSLSSSSHPWRSDYCAPSGLVLYKAESPHSSLSGGITVSISKLMPNNTYSPLAEIEYHSSSGSFKDSRIRMGNVNLLAKEVLRKGDLKGKLKGWGERLYTGPDGIEYSWKMTPDNCELIQRQTKMPIVTFHPKEEHLFSTKKIRPAFLEVLPQGQHMLDDIIITFVYMERIRSEKTTTAAVADTVGAIAGA